jgi:hypothetical protein
MNRTVPAGRERKGKEWINKPQEGKGGRSVKEGKCRRGVADWEFEGRQVRKV